MNRCFIFGALPVSSLTEAPGDGDYIIAADKGYDVALSLGLTPDLVVGDFDSRGSAPDAENVVRLQVRKDDTDVGHAVGMGFERGCTDFVVYGAVGGLLDHTFANVVIAHEIAEKGGRSLFIGNDYSFTVIRNEELSFPARDGGRISVFALGKTAQSVKIEGLSYGAENLTIPCTSHIGVSNSFIGKPARIVVSDGTLLVIWQNP